MAVVQSRSINTPGVGLYVPFRTAMRGGESAGDPVGTLSVDAAATGTATGGNVDIVLSMSKLSFGFHPLFIPTHITTLDTLATAEVVTIAFDLRGSERMISSMHQAELALAGAATLNIASFRGEGLLIEPDDEGLDVVMNAAWTTNEDGKAYHLHVFGYMFDAELLARAGRLSGLLGGVT